MDALNEIIERAMRLPPGDRRRIARAIDPDLRAGEEATEHPAAEERRLASISRLIKMGGTGHSAFTDVARRKHEHLAEIYADKHLPENKR